MAASLVSPTGGFGVERGGRGGEAVGDVLLCLVSPFWPTLLLHGFLCQGRMLLWLEQKMAPSTCWRHTVAWNIVDSHRQPTEFSRKSLPTLFCLSQQMGMLRTTMTAFNTNRAELGRGVDLRLTQPAVRSPSTSKKT